jgi:hypothetical protein
MLTNSMPAGILLQLPLEEVGIPLPQQRPRTQVLCKIFNVGSVLPPPQDQVIRRSYGASWCETTSRRKGRHQNGLTSPTCAPAS